MKYSIQHWLYLCRYLHSWNVIRMHFSVVQQSTFERSFAMDDSEFAPQAEELFRLV